MSEKNTLHFQIKIKIGIAVRLWNIIKYKNHLEQRAKKIGGQHEVFVLNAIMIDCRGIEIYMDKCSIHEHAEWTIELNQHVHSRKSVCYKPKICIMINIMCFRFVRKKEINAFRRTLQCIVTAREKVTLRSHHTQIVRCELKIRLANWKNLSWLLFFFCFRHFSFLLHIYTVTFILNKVYKIWIQSSTPNIAMSAIFQNRAENILN